MTDMFAGTARVDITPSWPVMLAGFGQRTEPAVAAHDPVQGKALYLAEGAEQLLVITTDLLSIPQQVGSPVAQAIATVTGLAVRQICICASHTHSAPNPGYAGDDAIGVERYQAFLIEALTQLGIAAVRASRPARVRSGVGAADIFFNRRTNEIPNRVDRRVPVLVAEDAGSGETLAVLFGAGCHPTVMGWDNMLISADFTGYAQRAIERALPGATALFMNLAQGNIIPVNSPRFDALDPRGYCGGTWEMAQSLGDTLAAEVLRVCASAAPVGTLALNSRRGDVTLMPYFGQLSHAEAETERARNRSIIATELGDDFDTRFPAGHLWSHASRHVIAEAMEEPRMRRLMIACCYYRAQIARLRMPPQAAPFDAPIQVFRIAGFTFLALPGEILVESGEEWSQLLGGDQAFIIAIANSHFRYIPGTYHFRELNATNRYETASAGLEVAALDHMFAAAVAMLTEMRRA
jgi:hypothetical protein